MRHSAAHVMAEAVMDLFPGTQAGHRARHRGRLLLRLRAAASADAGRPGGHRGAHGGVHRGRPCLRAPASCDPRGRPCLVRRARPALQGRDPRRSGGCCEAAGQPMPPVSTYQHGPFIDLCRGPHVDSTGKIGPVQAAVGRRRLLARRPEAADAAAHLRHGLGDAGGARPLPVAARGGQEARPPPPRRAARPVQLP